MSTMLRVSEHTRDRVMQVANEVGGTAEDALVTLLDAHWERQAVAAVEEYAARDPQGWADYINDAERDDAAASAPADGWRG